VDQSQSDSTYWCPLAKPKQGIKKYQNSHATAPFQKKTNAIPGEGSQTTRFKFSWVLDALVWTVRVGDVFGLGCDTMKR